MARYGVNTLSAKGHLCEDKSDPGRSFKMKTVQCGCMVRSSIKYYFYGMRNLG